MADDAALARNRIMRGLMEALVLDSIARAPKHGYALLKELEAVFGVPPNRNQIYPLLNRLVKRGLLKPSGGEGERVAYQLTGKGVQALREYKLMPASLRDRVLEFWEGAPAARDIPVAPPSQRDEGEVRVPPAALPRGAARSPIPLAEPGEKVYCPDATVSVRRTVGESKLAFEFQCQYGQLPECPMCSIFRTGELLKRRFF